MRFLSHAPNWVGVTVVAALVAVLVLIVTGAPPKIAAAESSNLASIADTKIAENAPTTNYGGATTIGVDGDEPNGSGKDAYSLLRWDLSSIPAGSTVNSASVTLNVTNSSPLTYQTYKLKRPWEESSATWLLYASDSPWEIAGAKGSLDRRARLGSVSPSATGKQSFALSAAVVQRWVDNPTSNRGIIIANSTNADGFDFSSRQAADASARPTLSVDYSPTSGDDPVLVGAGDIASCSSSGDEATAELLDSIAGTVYTTGDNAYESGTLTEFEDCYEPSWGRHKARTKPSPGNHEYHTSGASGYFDYFGAAAGDRTKGYYAYDLGEWKIYALNSMCEKVGGCEATSPLVAWLKDDLASNPKACTLAYFHHPLFSSGEHGNQTKMMPVWDALYAANAEVVLNGHDHDYERFAPQRPDGTLDTSQGIREFVVGTGGGSHYAIGTIKANS